MTEPAENDHGGILAFPPGTSDEVIQETVRTVRETASLAAGEMALRLVLKLHSMTEANIEARVTAYQAQYESFRDNMVITPHAVFWGSARDDSVSQETREIICYLSQFMVADNISLLHGGAATGVMGIADRLFRAAIEQFPGETKSVSAHIPLQFSANNSQAITEQEGLYATPGFRGPADPLLRLRTTRFLDHPKMIEAFVVCSGGFGTMDEVFEYLTSLQLKSAVMSPFAAMRQSDLPELLIVDQKLRSGRWLYQFMVDAMANMLEVGSIDRRVADNVTVFRPEKGKDNSGFVQWCDDTEACAQAVFGRFKTMKGALLGEG